MPWPRNSLKLINWRNHRNGLICFPNEKSLPSVWYLCLENHYFIYFTFCFLLTLSRYLYSRGQRAWMPPIPKPRGIFIKYRLPGPNPQQPSQLPFFSGLWPGEGSDCSGCPFLADALPTSSPLPSPLSPQVLTNNKGHYCRILNSSQSFSKLLCKATSPSPARAYKSHCGAFKVHVFVPLNGSNQGCAAILKYKRLLPTLPATHLLPTFSRRCFPIITYLHASSLLGICFLEDINTETFIVIISSDRIWSNVFATFEESSARVKKIRKLLHGRSGFESGFVTGFASIAGGRCVGGGGRGVGKEWIWERAN